LKLVFHGPLWDGSTSLQRLRALQATDGVIAIGHDTAERMGEGANLYRRVRWRLGWPTDDCCANDRLIAIVTAERPEVVIIEGSKVIRRSTLRELRRLGVRKLVYYTPDDVMNRANLKWPLRWSFPDWDVFFTTKTFNVPELKAHGVRNPYLIGKAYDPSLHRPMTREEIGEDYERFDLVFAGACERERMTSLNALCEAGFSVVVYGGELGNWNKKDLHPSMLCRAAAFGEAYTKAMHHGKLALCFLRKINRDKITQRSMEITAMGRPMLAEKTDEHDAHFLDGVEYAGFKTDNELAALSAEYLRNNLARVELGNRARQRCLSSGYSTLDRAREMIAVMR
jgi:spore maturation protein CgeB